MATQFRGTKEQLKALLRQLPGILAGTAPDPTGIGERLRIRMGNAFLAKVQNEYILKSTGGTDAAGITWEPPQQELGHPLLMDTDALFDSLAPGEGDRKSGAPGQVFEADTPMLRVGSEVPHAAYQFKGTKNIPARPAWPPDGNLPQAWWDEIYAALNAGIMVEAAKLTESA